MRIATRTTQQLRQAARRFVAVVVAAALCVLMPAERLLAKSQPQSQIQSAEATKAQVLNLHARGSQIDVTGQTRQAPGPDYRRRRRFFHHQGGSNGPGNRVAVCAGDRGQEERASSHARALTGVIVVGSVLLVLCAAPFPLGFLCQEDPS